MNKHFVSGLPGPDLHRVKSFAQVLEESRKAIVERRKREERRRLYSTKFTDGLREATARMLGERDV